MHLSRRKLFGSLQFAVGSKQLKTANRKLLTANLVYVLIFLALAIAAVGLTFQDTVQSNFNGGTFNFTAYNNSSQALELRNHSAQELPANATNDGTVNMTGNLVLLHFNNES